MRTTPYWNWTIDTTCGTRLCVSGSTTCASNDRRHFFRTWEASGWTASCVSCSLNAFTTRACSGSAWMESMSDCTTYVAFLSTPHSRPQPPPFDRRTSAGASAHTMRSMASSSAQRISSWT